MRKAIRQSVIPAIIGGLAVAVAFLLVGPVKEHTTTRAATTGSGSQAALSDSAPATSPAASSKRGLTAHQIYQSAAPGVVHVRSEIAQSSGARSPFDPLGSSGSSVATGSGFVIDKTGRILTNYHVIQGARAITVQFEDNKTATARVVGTDPSTDVALLKVDPGGLDLRPLALGSSAGVEVGDPVLAIGNPFGLDRTLTSGIVSALQRQITSPANYSIQNVIQTDAAINPGNSGGPLLDAGGRVIGINSQIATSGGSAESGSVGIGFAVPIDTIRKEISALESKGSVQHARLGIEGTTIDSSLKALHLAAGKGVLIQTVTPNGPADHAGLRGGGRTGHLAGESVKLGGDIITAIDGRPTNSIESVISYVSTKRPGEKVALTYVRGGSSHTVTVTLDNRPATAQTGG